MNKCRYFSIAALILLSSCLHPSAIIVTFETDLQVVGTDEKGSKWSARPEQIGKTVSTPIFVDPFGDTVFLGPMFRASFGFSGGGFGVKLTNTGKAEICFRFEDARVSSNFRADSIALRGWPPRDFDEERRMGHQQYWDKRLAIGRLPIPNVCLAHGEQRTMSMVLDAKELFPSGKMFNAAHEQHKTILAPDGLGNWLKFELPVVDSGRKELVEFTFTAVKSHARTTYY